MSIVSSDTEVPLDNITWAALATLCEIGTYMYACTCVHVGEWGSYLHVHSYLIKHELYLLFFTLALTNINLSSHCGIIKVLVRGLLKCQVGHKKRVFIIIIIIICCCCCCLES